MQEADAKTKICPVMTDGTFGVNGPVMCQGPVCMGWEQWTDPVYDKPEGEVLRKIIGSKPKEPHQGHCGMVPPELNCSGY